MKSYIIGPNNQKENYDTLWFVMQNEMKHVERNMIISLHNFIDKNTRKIKEDVDIVYIADPITHTYNEVFKKYINTWHDVSWEGKKL